MTYPTPPAHRPPPPPPPGPTPHRASLLVSAWTDPAGDPVTYDPCSLYVETFWLPVAGPTAILLLRRFSRILGTDPAATKLDAITVAREMGLSTNLDRNRPFPRALDRLVRFHLARWTSDGELEVRTQIPPVPDRHINAYPITLAYAHAEHTAQTGAGQ